MIHIKAFDKRKDLKEKYKSNAYMLWTLGLYLDEADLDGLAERSLTDGGNDKSIDFMEIDFSERRVVIAQGYFGTKDADKAPSGKASDINSAISWLANGSIDAKTLSPILRARILEVRKAIKDELIERIDILFIHNRPSHINSQEELETCEKTASQIFESRGISVSCKEFGLTQIEGIYQHRHSQILINDEIFVDGKKLGQHETDDWDAYLFTVKGEWLRDLFKKYDEDLFSANYRGFLGISKRKKINSTIKATAEKQPSDFWVFNNGVTLLTTALSPKNKRSCIKGVSIINGAQTTGSLGSVEENISLSSVRVMCRIVVCKNPDKIDLIVKYNNTQNKITTWDQFSNDDHQKLIKSQFDELSINYSLKRGFDSQEATVGIEKVVQPILAFSGFYEDANRGRNAIFDRGEIYKRAFHDKSARHIILAYCFGKSIDLVRRALVDKPNKRDTEEHQTYLFNYLSFRNFLMACIGATLEQFIGEKCTPQSLQLSSNILNPSIEDIAKKFENISRQVLRAVSSEIKNLESTEKIQVNDFLRDSASLGKITGRINSLLEIALDGVVDFSIKELLYVSN
jgi:hypothetical protein